MQPLPTLDAWTSSFLLAVAMGVFLGVLLLTNRDKKNRPIAFFVLAFSLILFQYVLYWTRYETEFPYLVLIPPLCYYSTGPLLYLYFLRLYKKEVSFNYALHFLPAVLLVVPNLFFWFKINDWYGGDIVLLWLAQQHWFIVAHMTCYVLLLFRILSANNDSTTEYTEVRRRWSKFLSILYGLFVAAYASYYVLVGFSFFNSKWDYAISFMMSFTIYAIGYFIFRQPSVFNGELYANLFLPIKHKEASFEDALLNELYANLTTYMEQEKPFIDNELRLVHLADQLGFSTHLLSKVINKKSGKNFNTFVNDYRLVEAEQLLTESTSSSIKSVYFDVGFNSKAAFYKAFRKKHHCTPSEYRANYDTVSPM